MNAIKNEINTFGKDAVRFTRRCTVRFCIPLIQYMYINVWLLLEKVGTKSHGSKYVGSNDGDGIHGTRRGRVLSETGFYSNQFSYLRRARCVKIKHFFFLYSSYLSFF